MKKGYRFILMILPIYLISSCYTNIECYKCEDDLEEIEASLQEEVVAMDDTSVSPYKDVVTCAPFELPPRNELPAIPPREDSYDTDYIIYLLTQSIKMHRDYILERRETMDKAYAEYLAACNLDK